MLKQEEYQTLLEQQDVSKSNPYSVSQLVKREFKKYDTSHCEHAFVTADLGPENDSSNDDIFLTLPVNYPAGK